MPGSHPFVFKPWVWMPAPLSHELAQRALDLYSLYLKGRWTLGGKGAAWWKVPVWRDVHWQGLYFPNPTGPAGGVDKSGRHLRAWWALGAGFVEVGTVTFKPQKVGPAPVLKRWNGERVLWNALGFPSEGVEVVSRRLKQMSSFKRPTPVFANIGKNRHTSNEKAHEDIIPCLQSLYPYVDAFVINVSSPNTKDLRQLARPVFLKPLLQEVEKVLRPLGRPFLIKWGPDWDSPKDFLKSLDTALQGGAKGHILCNTTTARGTGDFGENFWRGVPDRGGLSGSVLSGPAKKWLSLTNKHLGGERKNQLLVSSGGILSPRDLARRLDMGADLVQMYSAFVWEGPSLLRRSAKLHHQIKQKTSLRGESLTG